MMHLLSKTGLGRSGHVRFPTFDSILHVLDSKITYIYNMLSLHIIKKRNFSSKDLFSWTSHGLLDSHWTGLDMSKFGLFCKVCMLRVYHPGHIYLEVPRKTYFYLFLGIFGAILIKYLGFWSK